MHMQQLEEEERTCVRMCILEIVVAECYKNVDAVQIKYEVMQRIMQ